MNQVIEFSGVEIFRGQQQVLCIDQLKIAAGEIIAVIGSNGAGKSTLLQSINMLLPVKTGYLKLFGSETPNIDKLSVRRRCAMVFQDSLLLNDTVFNNVALPLRFRSIDENDIKTKVYEALELFHCCHLAAKHAKKISGGEAQRVSLARAFVTEPELLLLDEPFASLDFPSRACLLTELRRIVQEKGITALLVSHIFEEVACFSDRVIVINNGTIIQDGSIEKVLTKPVNSVVANIVGIDNIIACMRDSQNKLLLAGKMPVECNCSLVAPLCCIPGDALQIIPVEHTTDNDNSSDGVIARIVPGIGLYRIQVSCRGIYLWARIAAEQARKLVPEDEVVVIVNWDKVHFVAN